MLRAILHDEKKYKEPFAFNPDRFLKNGALDPDVFDPQEVAFGFGRRVCPGLHMAYDGMWIIVATVLACFEIGMPKDAAGKVTELREEFVSSFVWYVFSIVGSNAESKAMRLIIPAQ